MTQAEVEKEFEKNPKGWFTAKILAKKLKISEGSVNASLRALFKQRVIFRAEMKGKGKGYLVYAYKLNAGEFKAIESLL